MQEIAKQPTGPQGQTEREAPRKAQGLEVLIAFFSYIFLQVIAFAALSGLGYDLLSMDGDVVLVLLAASTVITLLSVALAVAVRRRSFGAVGVRRTSGRWILAGVGLGLLAWVVNRGIVVLYFAITGDTSNPQTDLTEAAMGGAALQFALLVLLGGLAIPLGEELLFRGVLYTWLRRWGVLAATLISAAVFGLFHGVSVILPAAIVVGVLGAIAYERSGSIWPAVAAHATNNTLIFVLTRVLAETRILDT